MAEITDNASFMRRSIRQAMTHVDGDNAIVTERQADIATDQLAMALLADGVVLVRFSDMQRFYGETLVDPDESTG